MENNNELEKPIGTKEQPKLAAGSVTVKTVEIKPAKEGSKAKIVKFGCKHPDKEELIILSNVLIKSIQGQNISIKKDALWHNLDDEGNIRKNSVLAEVMRFYKKSTLNEFKESVLTTEQDVSGYLAIKAY